MRRPEDHMARQVIDTERTEKARRTPTHMDANKYKRPKEK